MPDENRISATLLASDKQAILAAVATIRARLPFLLTLTPDEAVALPKMSDKSVAFDEKCASYMQSLPALVPGYVTVAEVQKDRVMRTELADVARVLTALSEAVEDTHKIVASEIWMADLSFYQSVRQAAKRGVPGAQEAYADLKARFPGNAGKPVSPPANPV